MRDVDGGIDADEDESEGSSDESQQGQTIVVNRLCGNCQCGSENDKEVIKDIDPDQVDPSANCTRSNERDDPSDLLFI